MPSPPPKLPKQAFAILSGPGKSSIYESTGGAVLAEFAAHNLTLLLPIGTDSVVHDNACGPGTVGKLILNNPRTHAGVRVHATDIDEDFLSTLEEDIEAHDYAIEASNQKSEALSFTDDFFDVSITNMGVIFFSANGLDGAKEIYRTLKPGGTAVVNCWEHITWLPPFAMVNKAIRPGVPFTTPPVTWSDGKQLQKIMLEAGFKQENIKVERSEAWAKTSDLRNWAEKAWAFLGGIGGWHEGDEGKWDEAVDLLAEKMLEQEGTRKVGEEVWMRASQWVVIATK